MTKAEAVADFRETILPYVRQGQNGTIDKQARLDAFGNYTDLLCRAGKITLKQYETWTNPFEWRK